ncbi:MAG: crossover junction endodeoxyribonuclease RuvC [Planctomycetes bacterium]|nr:crossover junction endodeoxyribonuclease RuvC [Planctomycetota bacterium]
MSHELHERVARSGEGPLSLRILGIDPGIERTGYGVVELAAAGAGPRLVEAGVIRTRAADGLPARLAEIRAALAAVISEFRPDAAAVEELYSHYAHPRTAILMGHARGAALVAAAEAGVPLVSYASTRIKKSLVGSGHASKQQVQRAVQSFFGLRETPYPPDVADALAVALCHAHQAGRMAIAR